MGNYKDVNVINIDVMCHFDITKWILSHVSRILHGFLMHSV